MKVFELWLDESGNFIDSTYSNSVSLVGGVLIEQGKISIEECKNIIGNESFHATEEDKRTYGDTALKILGKAIQKGTKFVIFENKARLEIVDGDTTYLNVLSEGIIQLIQSLVVEYDQIKLNIIAAVRLAVDRPDYEYRHIINPSEYEMRLQEKIILGLARKSLTSINKENWTISFSSAKTDHRLMLADVICHSWYTKRRKFSLEQGKVLDSFFNIRYYFSAFENGDELNIKKALINGNIGDAIFELFSLKQSEKFTNKYMETILSKLKSLNHNSLDCQLRNLIDKLINLLVIDNSYDYILNILNRIHKLMIPQMKSNNIQACTFFMDISLLFLTIATHQGNITLAEEHVIECDRLIYKMVNRWESLDYYFMYKIRKFQHDLNCYDLNKCIKGMDELERTLNDIFPLFTIAEGIGDLCNEIKSDNRGKVLGNRLQARFHLAKFNKDELLLARKDSDAAIKEFENLDDLYLQYQYRSRLEYEVGYYQEALVWLFKSMKLDENSSSFKDLLESLKGGIKSFASFTIMHYTTIMSELLYKDTSLAEEMYNAWTEVHMDSYLEKIDGYSDNHPFEIINWKLAKFHKLKGNKQASDKYYWRAVGKAGNNPKNITLKAIELGIKVDMLGVILKLDRDIETDISKKMKECYKAYYEFMKLPLPISMKNIFSTWKPTIDKLIQDRTNVSVDDLINLSVHIIY